MVDDVLLRVLSGVFYRAECGVSAQFRDAFYLFLPYSSLFDPTGATGTIFCSALFFTGSACGGITCMAIVRACGSADGNR